MHRAAIQRCTILLYLRLIFTVAAALVCQSTVSAQEAATKEAGQSQATEKRPENLPKNINQSFLDPELDVDKFVKRFEVESREVVACQKQILAAVDIQPGMKVADIGAGTGLYMQPFSKTVGEKGKVYAVDISPKFIKHLRRRARKEELENVKVVLCNDRSANLKPNSVDRAFICDVYHHFEYPLSSMKSIYDALHSGGKLVLVDFHRKVDDPKRSEWLMGHIRDPQEVFKQEIVDAGFKFEEEVEVDGFTENYLLVFSKP